MSPASSSTPGIVRSSKAATSFRSSQVPRSSTSARARRCLESQRANARGALSSAACRRGATRLGVAASLVRRMSPSECAGSVETMSVDPDRVRAARARAYATAQVVLPLPPLPAKKEKLGVVRLDLHALDPAFGLHRNRSWLTTLDLADPGKRVAFDLRELVLRNLAELELHLCLEQPLAQGGVVLHLGLGGSGDLVEDEAQRADQERVQDEHPKSLGSFE